jgi:hypothetical protein
MLADLFFPQKEKRQELNFMGLIVLFCYLIIEGRALLNTKHHIRRGVASVRAFGR